MDEPREQKSLLELDDIKLAIAGGVVAIGLVVVALFGMAGSGGGSTPAPNYRSQAVRSSSELRPVDARDMRKGENASDYNRGGGGGGDGYGGGGKGNFSSFQTWDAQPAEPCAPEDFDESVRNYGGMRMFAYIGGKSPEPCKTTR